MSLLCDEADVGTARLLSSIGDVFLKRYESKYSPIDLERATLSYERSVSLTADFDPEQGIRLAALGQTLVTRFHDKGRIPDIDMACFCFEGSLLNEPARVCVIGQGNTLPLY